MSLDREKITTSFRTRADLARVRTVHMGCPEMRVTSSGRQAVPVTKPSLVPPSTYRTDREPILLRLDPTRGLDFDPTINPEAIGAQAAHVVALSLHLMGVSLNSPGTIVGYRLLKSNRLLWTWAVDDGWVRK